MSKNKVNNVSSLFRYPGGKSKLRGEITTILNSMINGEDVQYREPFFGGGSIGLKMLSEHKVKKIWVNDKDMGIACLWTSVIRHPEELKDLVRGFIPSVQEFYDIKEALTCGWEKCCPETIKDVVDVGFKKLAIHQISYSGLGTKSGGPLGGEAQESNYKIDCRWSPDYLCEKIDKLHEMFYGVEISLDRCTSMDFAPVVIRNSYSAVIYLDPPYYVKGSDLYQHGFSECDHVRLSKLLEATPHKWLLSYDDCPEIRGLYRWANIKSVDVNYSITALKNEDGTRKSTTKPELLISNVPFSA